MTYARVENNIAVEYPLYVVDIEIRHNTSLNIHWEGGRLDGFTYVLVEGTEPPLDLPNTKRFIPAMPLQTDGGQWKQVWEVVDIPAEEFSEIQAQAEKMETARRILLENNIESSLIDSIVASLKTRLPASSSQPVTEGLQNL
jgi:hypothetical protein